MEEPAKVRKKKGKKKAKSREPEESKFSEESELTEIRSGSTQNLQEEGVQSDVVETILSDTSQEEIARKPLARSDSELTSILVVGDEPTKQSGDEILDASAPIKADDGISDADPDEITTMDELDSVRREAKLSLAGVESPLEEEQPTDNEIENPTPSTHEFPIDAAQGDASEKELEIVHSSDLINGVVDKENDTELSREEEEAPRRNADPEGETESMEKDPSMNFEQPQQSLENLDRDSLLDYNELDAEGNEAEKPWQVYKDLKRKEMDEEDPPDHDGEGIGNDTPKSDNVPDIDEFMGSVEGNDSGLGAKALPPSLYENPQQREMHKYVIELKQKMADEEINAYLDEFERKVEEEILQIGDISLEDVQEEERRLREEHIAYQQREARVQRDRQKELMLAMERAKKHVMTMFRQKCKQILMRQEHMMQRDRLLQDRIHRSFRRSENQLLKALKRKQGEVKTMYGDLIFADGQYDGSKCRRWKVDWKRTPQPVQIKLKCLRGVKNKLPASRYVLMASLYSRLGGHIMKWSNLKGQLWGGATVPITHDGEFFNIELAIDQSVFEVCPSSPELKAGMVLMFELFILRGSVTPTDKVVGWGCFPICDGNFNVVEGKHKTPMLRGNMDSSIDKFATIEKLIAADIDHWLCNLYFEIVKLPKYLAGQREYEVELQFTSQTSKLLNKDMESTEKPLYVSDKEKPPPPSILASSLSLQSSKPPPYDEAGENELDSQPGPSHYRGANLTIDVPAVPQRENSLRSNSPTQSSMKLRKMSQISTDLRQRKISNIPAPQPAAPTDQATQRPFTVYGSRKVVEEKGVNLSDEDSSVDSDYSDNDVFVMGKGNGLTPIKGQPGMYYKVRQNHQADHDANKIYTMLPKTPLLTQQQKRRKLTHLEELEQHTVAIKTKSSAKENVLRKGHTKLQYVRRMLPIELDVWQWRGKEFWSMMLMLVLTWWIRMYLHYVGQYVLLVGLLIPINSIEYLPYTVNIRYQTTILRTREEIGLLVVGPFTNIIVLIVLILMTYFFQLLYDRFPNLFARLIMAFGIQTALDPFWILIVDTAKLRYKNLGGDNPIGDAYRLFFHFSRYYSNGTVTLFISVSMTIFLYVVTIFCSCAIIYMYFMRLHNNGRMMDIYWRLHGSEASFFSPYDLEMSNEELGYICRKAEQWRGLEGEQRKVNVYHYAWEEEEVAEEEWVDLKSKKKQHGRFETITHISIHTVHLDGLRELHRHFLRLHTGAIVEVFGEVNMPGSNHKLGGLRKGSFQTRSPKLGYRNRSYSASSNGSSITKDDHLRASSQFLGLPVVAPS